VPPVGIRVGVGHLRTRSSDRASTEMHGMGQDRLILRFNQKTRQGAGCYQITKVSYELDCHTELFIPETNSPAAPVR
jgi:hypothetical protein